MYTEDAIQCTRKSHAIYARIYAATVIRFFAVGWLIPIDSELYGIVVFWSEFVNAIVGFLGNIVAQPFHIAHFFLCLIRIRR